jgi:myo-inositol 2-dehydrogenase/D-chiro-inositol 1-dehydrogenase
MKLAILGAGRMGSYRASVFAGLPEVREVVLASRSLERAQRLAASLPKARAVPLDAVYEEPIDAAVVSLASSAHAPALRRLLPRSLPVLCEKPLGTSMAETGELIELASEHGSVVQVGFQRRFDPAHRRARDLVATGELGTLYSVAMTAFDHELPAADFLPGSGGIFRDLHVHDFDIVSWLTGQAVATVTAYATVRLHEQVARYGDYDTTAVLAVMSDGLPVTIRGSRHDPLGLDFRMEVLGSKDSVTTGWSPATPLRTLEAGGKRPEAPWRAFLERFGTAFREETAAFVRLAQGKIANPCPPESSLEALRVALACEESVASRAPARVADARDPEASGGHSGGTGGPPWR